MSRFEQVDGVGARLKGTFPPGQAEASFRFQIPKSNDDSLVFRMTVPPHVAEMRVIAEASSTMNLVSRRLPTASRDCQSKRSTRVGLRQAASRTQRRAQRFHGHAIRHPNAGARALVRLGSRRLHGDWRRLCGPWRVRRSRGRVAMLPPTRSAHASSCWASWWRSKRRGAQSALAHAPTSRVASP